MDNLGFDMVCEGDQMLARAIGIVFSAKGKDRDPPAPRKDWKKGGATHYAIRPAVEGERNKAPEGFKYPHLMTWAKEPKPQRIVFYDNRHRDKPESEDQIALPFTLDAVGIADFAARWLAEVDYGKQPDHDGDNGRGWRVYVEGWGHIDSHWGAIVAVAPRWAMYGK